MLQDATIDQQSPNTNFYPGATREIGIQIVGGSKSSFRHSLFQADLSALTQRTITRARLFVLVSLSTTSSWLVSFCPLDTGAAWLQTEVTWNQKAIGDPWNAPGGDYTFNQPPRIDVPAPTATGTFELSGLESLCQDAIDNRAGNFNIIARPYDPVPPVSGRFAFFKSSTPRSQLGPYLLIDSTA